MMETDKNDLWSSLGLLTLRLGVGGYMLTHGWPKVQKMMAGDFAFGDPIGLGAAPSLVLVGFAEFFCAFFVLIGVGTRFAALPVAFAMGVAAFVAHGADPWTMGEGGRLFKEGLARSWASKEPALLYLVSFLALGLTGAGRFSVDGWLQGRRERMASRPGD